MFLGEPSHCYCGVGGILEGSPDSIQHLTHSIGGQGENCLIGQVKGVRRADLICLWGIGCGGGTIDDDRQMGVARG